MVEITPEELTKIIAAFEKLSNAFFDISIAFMLFVVFWMLKAFIQGMYTLEIECESKEPRRNIEMYRPHLI